MSIKGMLLRFFLVYTVLLVAVGFAMHYFGIKISGIDSGILAGCAYWAYNAFGKKNGRYFSGKEKLAVVLGIVGIDVFCNFFSRLLHFHSLQLVSMLVSLLLRSVSLVLCTPFLSISWWVSYRRNSLNKAF